MIRSVVGGLTKKAAKAVSGDGGNSLSRYWTPSNAVVENAAPTNIVLTYAKKVNPADVVTTNFSISGKTINNATLDGTGKIVTLTVTVAFLYGESITVVANSQNIVVTNNVVLDINAAAFLTAQSNTDETQKTALNKLVVDLKAINSIQANFVNFDTPASSILKAIYPFIGGSAAKHKFNLIDPRDEDAAFRLTFNGTITHDATGADPNGIDGYADTHLNPTTSLALRDCSLGYYSLEDNETDAFDIGAYTSSTSTMDLSCRYTTVGATSRIHRTGGTTCALTYVGSRGFFFGNRISNVRHDFYRGFELIKSNTTADTGTLVNRNIYLFGMNNAGTAGLFTNRKCCFAFIGKGIADAAIQAFVKAVLDYNVALGRGDLFVPQMATVGSPAAGTRVKRQIDGWNANIYHSIYLPSNYSTSRTWPVIIEYPGNTAASEWRNGLPSGDYYLGFGLSKGRDFIHVVAPFINTDKTNMAATWWGDGSAATQAITSTTDYLDAILTDLQNNFHANMSKVVLTGYSRGAIACGYIGCSSDAYSNKFIAWMPHSHHDGATYTVANASTRLARMLGKKTCITYGGDTQDSGYPDSQTGLGIVQGLGVTEEHYGFPIMKHDMEHALRVDDATTESIRTFLAQYK